MKMTDTIVETGAARAVDAVKTYGSGETEVQALAGVTVSFPAQQSTAMMSVVVALIGIVNTLSLSILERRRELGLLRVVGMEDKDVRQMVRIESVLISALGTITGVVLGVFTGWALIFGIDRLSDAGIAFSVPGGMLALVLVLGIGLGFLASLIPAQRSTRLEVLDAINAT
jgi:putative ABC transport system permease protein